CLQLGHAGRKGATKLMWEGIDEPLPEGAWPIISASPLPYFPYSAVPREMTRADMDQAIADYVAATKRGHRAGFDMVEMHAAHGFCAHDSPPPAHNPPPRRIRRQARKPPALPARSLSRHARRLARREADVGAHFGDRLGGWRAHRRRCGRGRARVRGRWLRSHR